MAIKQQYRLQVLLEIREKKKEQAEQKLGESLAALKKEQDRQKEMEDELQAMIVRREQKRREYSEQVMRGEMSAQAAVNANKFIERLKEIEQAQKEAIETQKGIVAQREEDVKVARQELVRATQDLKALEKHKEKWADDIKKEMQLKEEETLDEIAQTMFLNRSREE